jgi:hypothetical protein
MICGISGLIRVGNKHEGSIPLIMLNPPWLPSSLPEVWNSQSKRQPSPTSRRGLTSWVKTCASTRTNWSLNPPRTGRTRWSGKPATASRVERLIAKLGPIIHYPGLGELSPAHLCGQDLPSRGPYRLPTTAQMGTANASQERTGLVEAQILPTRRPRSLRSPSQATWRKPRSGSATNRQNHH